MERNNEKMMEEFKTLSTTENMDMAKKYFEALINDDVDAAFDITMKFHNLVSVETMACLVHTLQKVSNKITGYIYDHDDDDDFIQRMDEITELVEQLEDEEEEGS